MYRNEIKIRSHYSENLLHAQVQTQPMFGSHIAKSCFVSIPISVKILGTIYPPLKDLKMKLIKLHETEQNQRRATSLNLVSIKSDLN